MISKLTNEKKIYRAKQADLVLVWCLASTIFIELSPLGEGEELGVRKVKHSGGGGLEGGADYANKDDGTGPVPMAMVGGTYRVNSGGCGQMTLVVRARNMIDSNGAAEGV